MSKLRVLLADDEVALRSAFRRVLEARGVEVVGVAENGAELVKLSREVTADLILTDLRMPVMDGIEAARTILENGPPPIVVILSAYVDPSLLEEAKQAGVSAWLKKGLRSRELCERIFEIAGRETTAVVVV